MASPIPTAFIAALTALALTGCVSGPPGHRQGPGYGQGYGPGPGYGQPGRGQNATAAFGQRGFEDGLAGRAWPCERDARACGARSPDPRAALAFYQDGWRQGWTARCERVRRDDRSGRERCEEVLGGGREDRRRDDRRRDDFFRFGR